MVLLKPSKQEISNFDCFFFTKNIEPLFNLFIFSIFLSKEF